MCLLMIRCNTAAQIIKIKKSNYIFNCERLNFYYHLYVLSCKWYIYVPSIIRSRNCSLNEPSFIWVPVLSPKTQIIKIVFERTEIGTNDP
jgi:hypothetical protein